ncbi:hypothetical protein [Clostridium sp.]|uniref:hypothetical protein n=1 Tax=Clostridium sp. TaxID=1506 RepID=UPI0026310F8C|nr:hypothetical protein [uncultured Clostridium sp.]
MKNTKICFKCNSRNIIIIPGKFGSYSSGNNITWGISGFKGVKVTRYLCCECGYSEEWIDNKKDIESLQKKFK